MLSEVSTAVVELSTVVVDVRTVIVEVSAVVVVSVRLFVALFALSPEEESSAAL